MPDLARPPLNVLRGRLRRLSLRRGARGDSAVVRCYIKRQEAGKVMRAIMLAGFFLMASVAAYSAAYPPDEVPFVGTPMEVVDQMLEMAQVKPGDVVYDLGR